MGISNRIPPSGQHFHTTMCESVHHRFSWMFRLAFLGCRNDGSYVARLVLGQRFADQAIENRRADVPSTSVMWNLDEI